MQAEGTVRRQVAVVKIESFGKCRFNNEENFFFQFVTVQFEKIWSELGFDVWNTVGEDGGTLDEGFIEK